jgi:hypothetical protein
MSAKWCRHRDNEWNGTKDGACLTCGKPIKSMSTTKLTAAQVAVLRELAKPGAVAYLMRTRPTSKRYFWIISDARKQYTRQITGIVKLGFVSIVTKWGRETGRITDAGRAYLAQQEQKP